MPGQMVDPALLSQLGHDGVNPREACLALGPLGQGLGVAVPGDLDADGIPFHAVKPGVVGGCRVEELSPQELPKQGEGGRAVPLHLGWGRHTDITLAQLSAPRHSDLSHKAIWSCYECGGSKPPRHVKGLCPSSGPVCPQTETPGPGCVHREPNSPGLAYDPWPQGSLLGSTFYSQREFSHQHA